MPALFTLLIQISLPGHFTPLHPPPSQIDNEEHFVEFANVTAGSVLRFEPTKGQRMDFSWKFAGMYADVKSGPGPETVLFAGGHDETFSYENQCLFERSIDLSLADKYLRRVNIPWT
jgi:hypothetical protein